MAKKLNHILKTDLQLSNQYIVENPTTLAHNLTNLASSDNHRLLTLDIKDLYVNVPIDETQDVTKTHLTIHNDPQTTNQITNLLSTILAQNYFLFQSKIYKLEKGVAMGSVNNVK
jgi:hypothetical protein